MNHNPLVTIIIPIFKAEEYLEQCLNSVIRQTYNNIEIVCVNDGSPDNCKSILKNYEAADGRITVINKKNQGVSAARNDALQIAKGDYVAFVDADDWIENTTIEKALNVIDSFNVDIVMWGYTSEHGNKSINKSVFSGNKLFLDEELKLVIHRRFVGIIGSELARPELADSLCPVWGKLYSRCILNDSQFVSLQEIGSYEDGLFNLEVFGRANKAYYLDEHLYHYRRENKSAQTARFRPNLWSQWNNLYNIIENYVENNHLGMVYYEALDNRIALGIQGLGLNALRSPVGNIKKMRLVKSIIETKRYKSASNRLDLQYFPIHWKLFYFCAKKGLAFSLYIMLEIIQMLIR